MADNHYVLAMYDVRGKQKYIYSSSRLREIQGASWVIRDVFRDYLYPAAVTVRNQIIGSKSNGDAIFPVQSQIPFSFSDFEKRMGNADCGYLGEVIYDGGGNFFVLYKNAEICRKVTQEFTSQVLIHLQTLRVLCTYIEGVDPKDFKGDQSKLYKLHRSNENQKTITMPWGTLPVVQTDLVTRRPITARTDIKPGKKESDHRVSADELAKYKKFAWEQKKEKKEDLLNEKYLDRLVEKKGEESLLAVIYIDGNNMGAKVASLNRGSASYDECVNSLRRFSTEIQKTFIDDRMTDIWAPTDRKREEREKFRLVLGAGDEITIICNARSAYAIVLRYLKALPKDFSSCAGISVFHSHAPFADAYRIAEACCENGKVYMKTRAEKEDPVWKDACMVDFHFNQSGIGISLEDIRKHENTAEISDPWRVTKQDMPAHIDRKSPEITTDDVEKMAEILRTFGRGNVKGLLEAARNGQDELNMEIERIRGHMAAEKRASLDDEFLAQKEKVRKLIIRMIPVYDIWFSDGEDTAEGSDGK